MPGERIDKHFRHQLASSTGKHTISSDLDQRYFAVCIAHACTVLQGKRESSSWLGQRSCTAAHCCCAAHLIPISSC